MTVYEYLYERQRFEPGCASIFICRGGLVDSLSVSRDTLATFWHEGLTEAGNVLLDAVFSFEEIIGLEIMFTHFKIAITTRNPLKSECKTLLDVLIGLLNSLADWAFIADARTTIIEVNQASI